MYKNANFFYVK